jgi:enamine deaminase RidA (YjgF/YER057c/UK114 family)
MEDLRARLAGLGFDLPTASAPAGNYVPTTTSGGLLFVAGQMPQREGVIAHAGRVGVELSVEEGQAAAALCALNILAQLERAVDGDLLRVTSCLRLGGFVACEPTFAEQPRVLNGASDLIVAALGDCGRHVRTAVGVAALPRGAAVEVDAIFAIRKAART